MNLFLQRVIDGLQNGAIYSVVAIPMVLIFKATTLINFAQSELAMIGAFLGWQQVWVVLFLASLSGAVVGVGMLRAGGRTLASRLPFGTFLAQAAYLASLVGEPLVRWYLGLYR